MTSIRRSDEVSYGAINPEPEAAAAAQKPALKSVPPPSANQVEAHKQPQSSAKPVDAELVSASADLVKGYIHPGIFEKSRPDLAQKELSKLPPREFSAVLGKLESSGSLERFIGQLSPEQKTAFFDTAVRKGALQRETEIPSKGPLNPPPMPANYAIDANTPRALANAVNQSNLDVGAGFYQAQAQYLVRYEAAAKACTSGAELRALGPPAPVAHPRNGLSVSHPQYNQLHGEWLGTLRIPSNDQAHHTISNKLSDFMGEARAGSFFVEGKVDVEVGKVSLEANGRVADSGKAEGKAGGKAKLPNGAMVGLDSKGTATLGVHVGNSSVALKGDKVVFAAKDKAVEGKFELETTSDGKVTKLKAQAYGSGVSFDNGRGQVDVSLHEKAGGYGFADPHKGEFGGGVKGKLESGDDSLSFQVGFGMQGLSEANARHALNNIGIWQSPPELLQGKDWKQLSAQSQDTYRRLGWTEKEWSSKVHGRG